MNKSSKNQEKTPSSQPGTKKNLSLETEAMNGHDSQEDKKEKAKEEKEDDSKDESTKSDEVPK